MLRRATRQNNDFLSVAVILLPIVLLIAALSPAPTNAYAKEQGGSLTVSGLEAQSSRAIALGEIARGMAARGTEYEFYVSLGQETPKAVRVTLTWDNDTSTSPNLYVKGDGMNGGSNSGSMTKVDYSAKSFSYIAENQTGLFEFTFKFYGRTDYELIFEDVTIQPTSISAPAITTYVGEYATIDVSPAPEDSNVFKFEYAIDDPAVAAMNNGRVKGIATGTTFVTVTDKYSGATAQIPVTVKPERPDSSEGSQSIDMKLGDSIVAFAGIFGTTHKFVLDHPTCVQARFTWDDEVDNTYSPSISIYDFDNSYTSDALVVDFDDRGYTLTRTLDKGEHSFYVEAFWKVPYYVTLSDASVYPAAISGGNISVGVGGTAAIEPTVTPSNANMRKFFFTSSNLKVATVDSSGVVKGIKPGTATISIVDAYKGVKGTATVKVKAPSIARVGKATRTIAVDKALTLRVKNKSGNPAIQWKSSNKKVATVNSEGKVTAKSLGVATIAAKAKYGNTVKWTVHVNNKSLEIYDTVRLIYGPTIKNIPQYKKAKLASSKKSVAIIKDGTITPKKLGKTKVTVKAGGRKYTINIKVVCDHRYEWSSSYARKQTDLADRYSRIASGFEDQADYSHYMYQRTGNTGYLIEQNNLLETANSWRRKAIAARNNSLHANICKKCGARM